MLEIMHSKTQHFRNIIHSMYWTVCHAFCLSCACCAHRTRRSCPCSWIEPGRKFLNAMYIGTLSETQFGWWMLFDYLKSVYGYNMSIDYIMSIYIYTYVHTYRHIYVKMIKHIKKCCKTHIYPPSTTHWKLLYIYIYLQYIHNYIYILDICQYFQFFTAGTRQMGIPSAELGEHFRRFEEPQCPALPAGAVVCREKPTFQNGFSFES
jgi:hypothetical protein